MEDKLAVRHLKLAHNDDVIGTRRVVLTALRMYTFCVYLCVRFH